MAGTTDNESGASRWLALLVLGAWVVLVVALGFHLMMGQATAASARVNATLPDAWAIAALDSNHLAHAASIKGF